jgi:hypothetical protein
VSDYQLVSASVHPTTGLIRSGLIQIYRRKE